MLTVLRMKYWMWAGETGERPVQEGAAAAGEGETSLRLEVPSTGCQFRPAPGFFSVLFDSAQSQFHALGKNEGSSVVSE